MLVAGTLLTVFLVNYNSVEHFRVEDSGDTVIDGKNGITYRLAPMCYEAVAYMNDVYGVDGNGKEYHEVRDADPKKLICTVENDIFDLYYADGTVLPALSDFGTNYIRVCEIGQKAIQVSRIEKEDAESLITFYLESEAVNYPGSADAEKVYYLKLMSAEYGYIYYNLTYYLMGDGTRYLYDRTTGRCVPLGEQFKELIND